MTHPLEREHFANEAARLKTDPTFVKAIAAIRANALEALVMANATNPADVIRLQSKVMVCDEIFEELEQLVLNFVMVRPTIT